MRYLLVQGVDMFEVEVFTVRAVWLKLGDPKSVNKCSNIPITTE